MIGRFHLTTLPLSTISQPIWDGTGFHSHIILIKLEDMIYVAEGYLVGRTAILFFTVLNKTIFFHIDYINLFHYMICF